MTTINITPVGSAIPVAVDKKDFLGALGNCNQVNNIITINGLQYYLNSVEFGGVAGLFTLKGNLSCVRTEELFPNYPKAKAGDAYKCVGDPITNSGKIGGGLGAVVETGDFLLCLVDTDAGTQAAVGANWGILQYNIDTAALAADVASINAVKVFVALLSQSGTGIPTAIILKNTLGGTIMWSRNGRGDYYGTLAGVFILDKTAVFTGIDQISSVTAQRVTLNIIHITTGDFVGNLHDGILQKTPIEIRVYP